MSKDEALKLVLEALKEYCEHGAIFMPITAVEAIDQALAAPVQEPVLWLVDGVVQASDIPTNYTGCLYTTRLAQRQWVGLTDEEKQEWVELMPDEPKPRHIMNLINVIEVELKDKNNG